MTFSFPRRSCGGRCRTLRRRSGRRRPGRPPAPFAQRSSQVDLEKGRIKTGCIKFRQILTGIINTSRIKTGRIKTGQNKAGRSTTDQNKTGRITTG